MTRRGRGLAALGAGRILLAVVVLAAVLLLVGRGAVTLYIEALWHASVGYGGVFWRRVTWQWGARVLAGLGVGALIFVNLRFVAATLGGIQIKRRFGNLEISEQLPHGYVVAVMLGASALLALWFGAAVPRSVGTQLLLLLGSAPWGTAEPVLGRDLGFYVFWLPLLGSLVTYGLVVLFMVFTLVTAGYAATGALRWGGRRVAAQPAARLHLGVLLAAFLVLLAVRLWLGRYLLLLNGTSGVQGIFGFTDAQARLPALQTQAVLSLAAAAVAVWGARTNRLAWVAGALGGVVAGAVIIGQFYPALVQRFQVEPNELERETRYIEWNLEFTRMGLGLDGLERRPFVYDAGQPVAWDAAEEQFRGLPVWSAGALLTTYRELEARFPYYDFPTVAVDRYETESGAVPVAIAVREVDPGGIQDPNWQNLHIRERYVEGMGAVASLAARTTPEGRPPMILSGIPPETARPVAQAPELRLERPQVFFGARGQLYAAVTPGPDRFLAPSGEAGEPGRDFPAGIDMGSALRTFALAWRFRDPNLLFASELTRESRFVFRRRVAERARAVAPFLRYPEDPYPVVDGGRVVWILDAFTGTRAFPLAAAHPFEIRRSVTYLRNSVKVTVDAVTGRMDFYRVPVADPLADAWDRAFPGLLRPLEEMPASLREHLRYPKALLTVQAQALLQYHQETAPAFHGQQDVWALPQELAQGTSPVPYAPEYGIYRLPGDSLPSFYLATVFVPAGRQNLTGILAGRTDEAGRPVLVLLNVAVDDQVPGPRQIEALVEQDPQISQQFSLWRTGGSEVWTGHLHLVPVGGRLLYMEPVFLAAEADAIPELRRFVVSDGVRVAMTQELTGAFSVLGGRRRDRAGEGGGATLPAAAGDATWPRAALDLLARAEERLRAGDWAGYGSALQELRALLERLAGGGSRR